MMKGFLLLVFLSFVLYSSVEIRIIKNPTPTCIERNYRQLILYKELKESEDSESFLIKPYSLDVDDDENVYVYDAMQVKIFKYDKNLKLIKTFGSIGVGPGEIGGAGRGESNIVPVFLSIKKDILYVGDRNNRKVLSFNTNGDYLNEISLKKSILRDFCPAVDSAGNIFLHSDNSENNRFIIDKFGAKGELIT